MKFFHGLAFGNSARDCRFKSQKKIEKESQISFSPDIAMARNDCIEIHGLNLGDRIHILGDGIAAQSCWKAFDVHEIYAENSALIGK